TGRLPPALGLLGEEDRGFFQDLALLTHYPVLTPQPVQHSTLISSSARPGAFCDVAALHPLTKRVRADAQVISHLLQGLAALAIKPHRLGLELQGVRRVVGTSLHPGHFPS